MIGRQARDAESLKAAVINAALDPIVIIRGDGRIIEFNPAAERVFGMTAALALSKFMSDLVVAPTSAARSVLHDANVLGVFEQRVILDGLRRDGSRFPAEISIHPVSSEGQRLFVAYIRDLTAEREAAAAIEAQGQRLSQLEKLSAMSSLLSGVAHELNNPLAILVAQSTVLRDKAPTPDIERRADRIHAAALRAGRIVKSFLAMAQHREPVLDSLDLNAVMDDAVQFVSYGLRSAGIDIVRHFDSALPTVKADRDLMSQVFASLLVNAQQALSQRDGARVIEVHSFAEHDAVVIEVADNGCGVAPEIADRIFDPYFTTRAAGSATGVGLSLCRSVLASHGGSIILAEGGAWGGARFRVTLPRGAPAAAFDPDDLGRRQGLSILVVDDERDVAESLGELIELFGHRVCVETSATEALSRIAQESFDMVFSDYHMPGLDGLAFRRSIGLQNPALAARMVLMTGDTISRSGRNDPLNDGLVLKKPFTASEVRALLDRIDPET